MQNKNFIKEITSKDVNTYRHALELLIKSENNEYFKKLDMSSDFIFSYIKQKIINDFVKLVNKDNLNTIFEFSKIYSSDFEDLIVKSWLKLACEDLTDNLLELLENGSDEQKAYCALYFKHINDVLALDLLKQNSKSNFTPLIMNCAQALSVFGEKDTLNEMKNIVLSSNDEFEKLNAFEFICAYDVKNNLNFIIQNGLKSAFSLNVILSLFDFCDFDFIKNNLETDYVIKIFNTLCEGYPENLALNTLCFYPIFNLIKTISKINSQYAFNSLIIAQNKFLEFSSDDIYSFDLDKDTKNELQNIANFLKNLQLKTNKINEELISEDIDKIMSAVDVIKELKLVNYAHDIAKIINSEVSNNTLCAKIAITLKELNQTSLINQDKINNIKNDNIKALILSCMN